MTVRSIQLHSIPQNTNRQLSFLHRAWGDLFFQFSNVNCLNRRVEWVDYLKFWMIMCSQHAYHTQVLHEEKKKKKVRSAVNYNFASRTLGLSINLPGAWQVG